MADNDIQFLGNWNLQESSSHSAFVSAIVLQPTDGSAFRTFSRSQTSVIHIGRIPTSDATDTTVSLPPDNKANFTNPVMSRNHAKITFSDSGSAFIIDTNSHHGTWVSRPTSIKPRVRLTSESPYMLLDGDKVTFGRDVVKNGVCHQPLTLSIKLLRTSSNVTSSIETASTPNDVNDSPKVPNRFGLGDFSESDSSDNEGTTKQPSTGPNSIYVEFPLKSYNVGGSKSSEFGNRLLNPDSPSSDSSSSISSSPSSKQKASTTPQHSPIHRLSNRTDISPALSNGPSRYEPEIRPPGLELSGMGNESRNTAPMSGILSVARTTPPWRRAAALLSAGHLFDVTASSPDPQRQIGRPLNPMWMRNIRAESGGDAPALGGGLVQSHGARLLSSVGIFGRFRGRDEQRMMDHSQEKHGRFHERHLHRESHVSDNGIHGLREDAAVPLEDVPSVQRSHEALSARLNDLSMQLAAIQDTTRDLQRDAPLDELSHLKATLASLETMLAALKADMTLVQDDVSGASVDIGALRVDLANLRARHDMDLVSLHENVSGLRADAFVVPRSVDIVAKEMDAVKGEYGGIRDEVAVLQTELVKLRGNLESVDAVGKKFSEDFQGMEKVIAERIRDEMREAFASRDSVDQSSGRLMRKRRYDEAFSSDETSASTLVLAAPERRPFKRLRAVANFAAAGVVGAFGTYLGLAYLQL